MFGLAVRSANSRGVVGLDMPLGIWELCKTVDSDVRFLVFGWMRYSLWRGHEIDERQKTLKVQPGTPRFDRTARDRGDCLAQNHLQ